MEGREFKAQPGIDGETLSGATKQQQQKRRGERGRRVGKNGVSMVVAHKQYILGER